MGRRSGRTRTRSRPELRGSRGDVAALGHRLHSLRQSAHALLESYGDELEPARREQLELILEERGTRTLGALADLVERLDAALALAEDELRLDHRGGASAR